MKCGHPWSFSPTSQLRTNTKEAAGGGIEPSGRGEYAQGDCYDNLLYYLISI